jgi:hypothetical protein
VAMLQKHEQVDEMNSKLFYSNENFVQWNKYKKHWFTLNSWLYVSLPSPVMVEHLMAQCSVFHSLSQSYINEMRYNFFG